MSVPALYGAHHPSATTRPCLTTIRLCISTPGNHPGGRLRRLARRPHPESRGHLPGNAAPDGHHLLPAWPHRRGRVAPSTARPQQAPAPALPPLRHATCNAGRETLLGERHRRAALGYRTRGRDTATFQIVLSGIRTTPQRPLRNAFAAGFTGLALAWHRGRRRRR